MNDTEYQMTVGLYAARYGERRQADRRAVTRDAPDRRRRGRPPLDEARTERVGFKASPGERRRLQAIATLNGQTLADFVREAVIEAVADCSDDSVFRH